MCWPPVEILLLTPSGGQLARAGLGCLLTCSLVCEAEAPTGAGLYPRFTSSLTKQKALSDGPEPSSGFSWWTNSQMSLNKGWALCHGPTKGDRDCLSFPVHHQCGPGVWTSWPRILRSQVPSNTLAGSFYILVFLHMPVH